MLKSCYNCGKQSNCQRFELLDDGEVVIDCHDWTLGTSGAGRTRSCATSEETAEHPAAPAPTGHSPVPHNREPLNAGKELQKRLTERGRRLEKQVISLKLERDGAIHELHEIDLVFEELDKPLHKNDTRPLKIRNLYAIIRGYADLVTTHEDTIAMLNTEIKRVHGKK